MLPLPPGALVLLVGPPASGKSTFAAALVEEGLVEPTGVLSTDDLRRELTGSAGDLSAERRVFSALRGRLVARLAAGRTTVVDATNLWPARRARHLRVAASHHRPVVALVFDAPIPALLARNAGRHEPVPPGAIVTMARQLERAVSDEQLRAEGCHLVLRVSAGAG